MTLPELMFALLFSAGIIWFVVSAVLLILLPEWRKLKEQRARHEEQRGRIEADLAASRQKRFGDAA